MWWRILWRCSAVKMYRRAWPDACNTAASITWYNEYDVYVHMAAAMSEKNEHLFRNSPLYITSCKWDGWNFKAWVIVAQFNRMIWYSAILLKHKEKGRKCRVNWRMLCTMSMTITAKQIVKLVPPYPAPWNTSMQICRAHDGNVCISVELNGKQQMVTPWPQTSHTEAERWAWCMCMCVCVLVIRCSMCKSKLYGSVRLYGLGIEEITVKFGFYLSLYVIGFIKYNAISVTEKKCSETIARAGAHTHTKSGVLLHGLGGLI